MTTPASGVQRPSPQPVLSSPVYPTRHRRLLPPLARLAMRLTGWRFDGRLPALPKFVLIVAPHTSNWDFPVGVMGMFALDLDAHWLAKDSIFREPFGTVLRRLGGRPVFRGKPEGLVADVAAMIRAEPKFLLAMAPEGTRRQVKGFKSGFYHMARAAGVPIVPVRFDYARREIGILAPFEPTGDAKGDIARLQSMFTPEMARHPSQFWTG